MTGIELVAQERKEQIEKHGYNDAFVKAHPEYYADGQLLHAAIYTITGDHGFLPDNWPIEDIVTLKAKTGIESIKVAAAMLAAEIDRLQSLEQHNEPTCETI